MSKRISFNGFDKKPFFDKKSKGSGIKSMSNQQLENELHKSVIRKSKKKRYILLLNTIFGVLI